MNLLEMATFICGKVNQTEAEDLTACKGFCRQRHEMLWADQLWKDSVVSYTQLLSPTGYTPASTWLPTKGVLLVPPLIARVLAVRTDSNKLNVQRPEFFYRVDVDAFAKQGTPTEFLVLPGTVWEWDTIQTFFLHRLDAGDAAARVTMDTLDSDSINVTRSSLLLPSPYNQAGTTERIDAVQKLASAGGVTIEATASSVLVANSGTPELNTSYPLTGTANGRPFYGTLTTQWIIWTGLNWEIRTASIPGRYYSGAEDVTFPQFVTTWTLNGDPLGAPTVTGLASILSLAATDTAARLRQRVRLVNIPDKDLTVRVLGKRTAPQLTSDQDQPGLTGSENCLLALAQGDMLERERHYAKADAKYKEGQLLLQQLKTVEMVQQAHSQRIVPETGYGDEDLSTLSGFSF